MSKNCSTVILYDSYINHECIARLVRESVSSNQSVNFKNLTQMDYHNRHYILLNEI